MVGLLSPQFLYARDWQHSWVHLQIRKIVMSTTHTTTKHTMHLILLVKIGCFFQAQKGNLWAAEKVHDHLIDDIFYTPLQK